MAQETVTNGIADLVVTNPVDATDIVRYGAYHLRAIKYGAKVSFAGFTGSVLVTGTDTGSADAYVISPATAVPAYKDRMLVLLVPANTNATTTPTLNISALGSKTIASVSGGALTALDLVAGRPYKLMYDASTDKFRLLNVTKNYVDQLAFGTALPAQSGRSLLVTNGSVASWAADQTGSSGKFLTTNGTTPSWAYAGIATINATVTTDATLTGTYVYVPVQMAALGKSVTLPSALTLSTGGPQYIIDNTKGTYPAGIRDNTGTLIMAVAAGGEAFVTLKDNTSQAGVWSVTGTNLEPGLITIDSTFSSTYASTVLAPFVALDSNTSIHFAALSSGFAAFVVDNTGKVLTTPVTVDATSGSAPRTCFKVSSTTAILFYGASGASAKAVILSLSGTSPALSLSVGTPANATDVEAWNSFENFTGAPIVSQLSSTLYLSSYVTAGVAKAVAISVSGTTVTIGTPATILGSGGLSGTHTTYALTATTALVLYKSGASAPYANNAVVVSVSGTTCNVGTPAALTGVGSSLTAVPSSCLLSATKCLVQDDNNTAGSVIASVFTVSGTTVIAGTLVSVETGIGASSSYAANSATRYNPHLFPLSTSTALLWYFDTISNASRAVVLTESSGTVTAGAILYRSIAAGSATASEGGLPYGLGTSEFIAFKQEASATSAWRTRAIAHKISGTAITAGVAYPLLELPLGSRAANGELLASRLSSGDYVVLGANTATQSIYAMPVFRSNGDAISYRGRISCPALATSLSVAYPAVASNRVVVIGSTQMEGTTIGASTYQLRLLNVEIAQ
jgi:hypothetical protein